MPSFLKRKKPLIILFVLIFFQMVLISIQVPLEDKDNYFERAVFSIFAPLQHGTVSVFKGATGIWKGYFWLRDVHGKNMEIERELFRLRHQNILLKQSLQRFKDEEEIMEIVQRINQNLLYARVIGFDSSNFFKSVNINRGSLDGIARNMVVIDRLGNLMGRVVGPVTLKEARVQLITDNMSGISICSQTDRSIGILTGMADGLCRIKYILATDTRLKIGDSIVTTGYDGIYPPGIPVGEILSVTSTSDLFQDIKVKPYFDFRHLDKVAVIKLNPKEFF